MTNFILKIEKYGYNRNYYFINMIGFDGLSDANHVIKSEVIRKIMDFLHIPIPIVSVNVLSVEDMVTFIDEKRDENLLNSVVYDTFIIKGSDDCVRLCRFNDIAIRNIIPTKILKISVYETKEDIPKYSNKGDVMGSHMGYKKISGGITYIKSFEGTVPLAELVDNMLKFNDSENIAVGFLVEYHDVRSSTIKFVEGIMNNLNEAHMSINLVHELNLENKLECVISIESNTLIRPVYKQPSEDTVILIEA